MEQVDERLESISELYVFSLACTQKIIKMASCLPLATLYVSSITPSDKILFHAYILTFRRIIGRNQPRPSYAIPDIELEELK